jgi:hypothetical protein
MVRSAASYASQSERTVTFGLGSGADEDRASIGVRVTWPDGTTQTFEGLTPGRLHRLEDARRSSP